MPTPLSSEAAGYTPLIRRILLAIVIVSGFAELAYVIVNISAMPVFIPSIGLPDRWIGIAATAFIAVEGLLKSPFGLLGDRIGRKALILSGPLVSIFTCLLTPHVHNPYALVGLRVLDGLGAAALWPAAFSLIGDYVPEARRASAMSLFNLAYLLGIALGPIIGGGINDLAYHHLNLNVDADTRLRLSKEYSFYVAAGFFALTSLVAYLLLPKGKATPAAGDDGQAESGFNFAEFRTMLGNIPLTLLMTFVTFLGIGLVMAYTKRFALDTFHMSESQFGTLLLVPALIISAASVKLGSLGDRIGKARAVQLGIGTCALAYWTLIFFFREWTMVLFGSLIGAGFVIAFPAWMALITATSDARQRGSVVGAVGTAQGLGAILGVLISSRLYERPAFSLGPLPIPAHGLPFLLCGVMLLVSFVLAVTTIHDPAPEATSV